MPRQKTPDEYTRQLRALRKKYGVKAGRIEKSLKQAAVDEKLAVLWRELTPQTHRTVGLTWLAITVQERLGVQKAGRWKGHYYDVDTIQPLVINWLRRLPLTEQPQFLLNLHQPHIKLATKQHVAWQRRELKGLRAFLKELKTWRDPQEHVIQVIQKQIAQIEALPPNPYLSLKRRSSPAK